MISKILKPSTQITKTIIIRAYAVFSSKQKFLFFFGAPGVGKGTFAQILAKDYGFNQISTGDEIRKIIKGKADNTMDKSLISEINDIVSSGKLVSDKIVIDIIQEKLKEPQSKKGVIFDGFPRNLSQMQAYDARFPTHIVFNIHLNYSVLLEKLMGRRTCIGCGKSYNICNINRDGYVMKPLLPKKECTCDVCGDKLIVRSDDTEAVISQRMDEYNSQTAPLLEMYRKRGVLLDFEPKKGMEDYKRFFDLVKPKIDAI